MIAECLPKTQERDLRETLILWGGVIELSAEVPSPIEHKNALNAKYVQTLLEEFDGVLNLEPLHLLFQPQAHRFDLLTKVGGVEIPKVVDLDLQHGRIHLRHTHNDSRELMGISRHKGGKEVVQ